MANPQAVIQELTQAGYSEARIAELLKSEDIDIAQSTINRIKSGKQSARFDVGAGLIRLRDRLLNGSAHESSGG